MTPHLRKWQLWYIIGLSIVGMIGIEVIDRLSQPAIPVPVSRASCDPQEFRICVAGPDKSQAPMCSCWLTGKGMEDNYRWLDNELSKLKKGK